MHGTAMLPKAQPAKPTQGSTASMQPLSEKIKKKYEKNRNF